MITILIQIFRRIAGMVRHIREDRVSDEWLHENTSYWENRR